MYHSAAAHIVVPLVFITIPSARPKWSHRSGASSEGYLYSNVELTVILWQSHDGGGSDVFSGGPHDRGTTVHSIVL